MASGNDLDDGFYVKNLTPHVLRFEAYDANSQRMIQDAPTIINQTARYISTEHMGSADYIYLLCFFDSEHYNPPPGIGIIADGHGSSGGGGLSISIAGFGFGASGSGGVTVTDAFSQPSLVARMDLKAYATPGHPPYPATHRWSCMEVTEVLNDKGVKVLQPVFVVDAITGEEVGPPGWDRRWFFGGFQTAGGWAQGWRLA